MQIELNKNEIELIDTAPETWEKEAHQAAIMSSMLSVMTRKTEDPKEKFVAEVKSEMAGAAKEAQQRRIKSILLRAKLFQALSRESEHDLTPDTEPKL